MSRSKPCNHAWIAVLKDVSHDGGIYSVWARGKLLYIGSSKNIRFRLMTHTLKLHFQAMEADSVLWIVTGREYLGIEPEDLLKSKQIMEVRMSMEKFLIDKHKPILNSPYRDSLNLRPYLVA